MKAHIRRVLVTGQLAKAYCGINQFNRTGRFVTAEDFIKEMRDPAREKFLCKKCVGAVRNGEVKYECGACEKPKCIEPGMICDDCFDKGVRTMVRW